MKIKFLILFFCCVGSVFSQVGVNTGVPKGIFHIDSNGDTESSSKLEDDFIVDSDGNGGVSVGIGSMPVNNASLNLSATDKAFLPNRVVLTDARGSGAGVANPIANPVDGMVVYNTAKAGTVPNNVIPGLYIFNGNSNRWFILEHVDFMGQVNAFELASALPLPVINTYSDFLANGTLLPLKYASTQTVLNTFPIDSEAAYAVSINLSGKLPDVDPPTGTTNATVTFQRIVAYAAVVLVGDNGQPQKILDVAEICAAGYLGYDITMTYPLVLGFNGKTGQKIGIMLATTTGNRVWTLSAVDTTVFMWKV